MGYPSVAILGQVACDALQNATVHLSLHDIDIGQRGLVGIRMALRFAGQLLVQKHVLVQNFQREIFTMAFTGEVFAVVLAQKKNALVCSSEIFTIAVAGGFAITKYLSWPLQRKSSLLHVQRNSSFSLLNNESLI